jgi:hypothetical protein
MIETAFRSMSKGRSQSSLGATTAARARRADETAASRTQSIKNLGSANFCRPRS